MNLDRASIMGRSFARTADGYDRGEVDRHLAAIAETVEAGRRESVREDAGEQLRRIVEGAEQSAAALRETAEEEVRALREAAQREAEATRTTAAEEAREQVANAHRAVKSLLERVEALRLGIEESQSNVREAAEVMADRLGQSAEPLLATLRERGEALGAELDLIGSGLAGGVVEAAHERADEAEADSQVEELAPEAEPEEPGTGLSDADLDEAVETLEAAGREPGSAAEATGDGDSDGGESDAPSDIESGDAPPAERPASIERGRLVALSMALSGAPRSETDRHLRTELGIEDPEEILDEAYDRAEKAE